MHDKDSILASFTTVFILNLKKKWELIEWPVRSSNLNLNENLCQKSPLCWQFSPKNELCESISIRCDSIIPEEILYLTSSVNNRLLDVVIKKEIASVKYIAFLLCCLTKIITIWFLSRFSFFNKSLSCLDGFVSFASHHFLVNYLWWLHINWNSLNNRIFYIVSINAIAWCKLWWYKCQA